MAKNGVKIQNFEKSKKVSLDISEIHVVSKFGPIPMKIVAGSLNTHIHTHNGHFSTPVYQYTNIPYIYIHNHQPTNIPLYSTTNLPTTQTSTLPLYPQLMFCYQALRADYLREAHGNKTLVLLE